MNKYNLCECSDPACPVCRGKCKRVAGAVLCRVDMLDKTGTAFCEACADDAMESGLYTDSKERDARQAEWPDDIDDIEEQDADSVYCPACDGDGAYIGGLGQMAYFRCIQCGMTFSRH